MTAIKELAEQIQKPPFHLNQDKLWQAYATLQQSHVKGVSSKRLLTDLISLCRFASHLDNELVPFADRVQTNFASWLAGQRNQGIHFTAQQLAWLEKICQHITGNLTLHSHDFDYGTLAQSGGLGAFYDCFGDDYENVIDQLNTELVA